MPADHGGCNVLDFFFFFFQAEDGIRDLTVTGVQTCALPISGGFPRRSLRVATRSSGSSPTVTVISRLTPLRHTSRVALFPGLVLPTIRGNSVELDTGLPSNLRIMSPVSTPAFSAGPPFSTEFTRAPAGLESPKDSASSLETSWITTPIRPRATRPNWRSEEH